MQARIFQPSKSAMQSGTANARGWVLEYTPAEAKRIDPLMGWTGSGDMKGQVRLTFDTREAAEDYARRNGIAYTVEAAQRRRQNIRPMGYGGNFAHDRRGAWTH